MQVSAPPKLFSVLIMAVLETLHQMSKRLRSLSTPVIYVDINTIDSELFHVGGGVRHRERLLKAAATTVDDHIQHLLEVPQYSSMTTLRLTKRDGRPMMERVPEPVLVFEAYHQLKPSGARLLDFVVQLGDSAATIDGVFRECTAEEKLELITEEEKEFHTLIATADLADGTRESLETLCMTAKATRANKLHLNICRVTRFLNEEKLASVRQTFAGRLSSAPISFLHDFAKFQYLVTHQAMVRRYINARYAIRVGNTSFWQFEVGSLNFGKYPMHHTTEVQLFENLTAVVCALGFANILDTSTAVNRDVISNFNLESFKSTIWPSQTDTETKSGPHRFERPKSNEAALNYSLRKFGVEIVKAGESRTTAFVMDENGKNTGRRGTVRKYTDKIQHVSPIEELLPYLTELPIGVYDNEISK